MKSFINNLLNKRWLRVAVLLGILLFLFLSFSQVGLARELENQYPKIPLPNLPGFDFTQNYSLNDIVKVPPVPPFDRINPLSGLIYYFFAFAVSVVGIVAFGTIIYTGVMFVMSGARPQVRAEAMKRLRNTLFGIALLLGSVIILNTINPELTILNVPPVDWKKLSFNLPSPFGTEIDLETLRYGGVVLFAESAIDGQENRSETVLNNIKSFNDGTYINSAKFDKLRNFIGTNDLSAIKILGACRIDLFNDKGLMASYEGPVGGSVSENDSASSLEFRNTSCLGHSITAYSGLGYEGQVKAFIVSDEDLNGNKLLMHRQCPAPPETVGDVLDAKLQFDHCDVPTPLSLFVPKNHEHDANDNIESISFAREPLEEFHITACKHPTNETNRDGDCKDILRSNSSLDVNFKNLYNQISAIVFGGNGKNRQAGVVLYEEDNFGGKSEIFIAGDNNFGKNFIGHNSVSSLQIIGKYKVTLYEKDLSDAGGGKTRTFDNTAEGSRAILEVKKLSAFPLDATKSWDNNVSAIKIEVPEDIYIKQKLGPTSVRFVSDPTDPSGQGLLSIESCVEKETRDSPLCVL